jgi:hypothetical protein
MYGLAKLGGAIVLVVATLCAPFAFYNAAAQQDTIRRADFQGESFSPEVHRMADWAVHSGDNQGLPFIVVDKVHARAVAFDGTGRLVQATPVLLGMGVGDKFAPGVSEMTMHETQPWQRITPAGRFFAEEDLNLAGHRVLWVDYDTGIAIHRLPAKETKQRRRQRIVSLDPKQHRITYGCINVAPAFYDRVVHPHFRHNGGFVYVLPDSTPLTTVFKSVYDVGGRRLSSAAEADAVDSGQTRRF